MVGWLSLMVVIAVAGREAAHDLEVFQIMVMRSVIGVLMLYPLIRRSGGFAAMRSTRLRQHAARNIVHYAAQYGWFVALTLIPLAQVVAIEFTMPLWTALFAAVFLGERLSPLKLLAVALGLIGVALIVKPAAGSISPGQLVALAASVGFAASVIMTKSLTRTDSPVQIIFWMLVVQSVVGIVPALMVWRVPPTGVWGWILVIAFCGTFSHYCMTHALRHAEATAVVPIDFVRVPLTALVGWLVYAERIDPLTVVGTLLILVGNLLNLGRLRTPRAADASRPDEPR